MVNTLCPGEGARRDPASGRMCRDEGSWAPLLRAHVGKALELAEPCGAQVPTLDSPVQGSTGHAVRPSTR